LRRAHARPALQAPAQGPPKDYGIKLQCMFSAAYPAPAASSQSATVIHAFIPFPFGFARTPQMLVAKQFLLQFIF